MDPRSYRPPQIANILTPAVGFLLSIPAVATLVVHALGTGSDWYVVSSAIYGATLVISYAAFTLYHVFEFHERWGRVFKILDHSTIYLLIAGTYTPFALVYLRGHWGGTLFGAVWALTFLGVLFKTFYVHRFRILAPLSYLFMGWLILFAIEPAMDRIPPAGLYLLLAGGLFYTSGLVFYAWKRPPFHHAIWHLFVLAGSTCHYFAIYHHVVPRP